ncbi:MAG: aminotransferase class V-fold PLP-dependent enzyme [Anaerolineaceae bacterium]|nr:aminotransferase class V-fold PLP-dependent enzyme [Anaerolineaceae bacterium]
MYLDTACQSLRPMAVMDAVKRYNMEEPACAGCSMHHLADAVSRDLDHARNLFAWYLHAAC